MKQINIFKSTIILLVLVFHINNAEAQEALLTSGNSTTDTGGSVSYSIGQIFQENTESATGSSLEGIQFYFEGSTLTIIDAETNSEISTYPNPSTSILNISTKNFKPNTLIYKLYDITGKLITKGNITDKTTKINVDNLDMATYLLKVSNTINQTTKTFKIIKN